MGNVTIKDASAPEDVARGVASIGVVRCADMSEALRRFDACISAVNDFVKAHPMMLVGSGEFVCVFGERSRIKVLSKAELAEALAPKDQT